MFFSSSVPAVSIAVKLTRINAGEHYITGKHVLVDVLNGLDPNASIEKLEIRGVRLWLSSIIAVGNGDDAIFRVTLPQKLNNIRELIIDLSEDDHTWNSIDGDELSILLGALPNVEKLTISCQEIKNSKVEFITGIFDLKMQKVVLPNLKSCSFTTYGNNYEGNKRIVDPDIIQCLFASAPKLQPEAIKQLWMPELGPVSYALNNLSM